MEFYNVKLASDQLKISICILNNESLSVISSGSTSINQHFMELLFKFRIIVAAVCALRGFSQSFSYLAHQSESGVNTIEKEMYNQFFWGFFGKKILRTELGEEKETNENRGGRRRGRDQEVIEMKK